MPIDNLVSEKIFENILNEKTKQVDACVIELVDGFMSELYNNGVKNGQHFDVHYLNKYITANRSSLSEKEVKVYLNHTLEYLKKTVEGFKIVDKQYICMPKQSDLVLSRFEMHFEEMQSVIMKNAKKDPSLSYVAQDIKVYNHIRPIADYVYLVTEMGWPAGRGNEIKLSEATHYCEKILGTSTDIHHHLTKNPIRGINVTKGRSARYLFIDSGYKTSLKRSYNDFSKSFELQKKKGMTKTRKI